MRPIMRKRFVRFTGRTAFFRLFREVEYEYGRAWSPMNELWDSKETKWEFRPFG